MIVALSNVGEVVALRARNNLRAVFREQLRSQKDILGFR